MATEKEAMSEDEHLDSHIDTKGKSQEKNKEKNPYVCAIGHLLALKVNMED